MVVFIDVVLLAGTVSVWFAVTVAVLVAIPGVLDCAVTVAVEVPFAGIVPTLKVTKPPDCENVPWVLVPETYVSDAGSVSFTNTFVAKSGPLFLTTSV
jgi:hypothetical protein